MIYGEDSVKYLMLENKGALGTDVIIKSTDGADILTRTETASQGVSNRLAIESS